MREIKYRAKSSEGWLYGSVVYRPAGTYLSKEVAMLIRVNDSGELMYSDVYVRTVGESTGLLDKNGKEVYEGDIVIDYNNDTMNRLIKWSQQNASFYLSHTRSGVSYYKEFIECGQSQSGGPVRLDNIEVIGNMHDNPELIKEPTPERSVATKLNHGK